MITKKMVDAINEQINWELYSAYLYVAMGASAASAGLNGFANWFNVQVKEELTHTEKFYNYVLQQGGKIKLKAIAKPTEEYGSPAELFTETLEHEEKVTGLINKLVDVAKKENDHATQGFLQWFVSEQVEEVSSAADVVQRLKLIGKDGNGLLLIDSQLATRTFVPPQAGGK